MPKYKSVDELKLKHQEVLKIVNAWPEEKKQAYLPIIEEKYNQNLRELTNQIPEREVKRLRTQQTLEKLSPEGQAKKQRLADEEKIEDYSQKFNFYKDMASKTVTDAGGTKSYAHSPDIRSWAAGKALAYEDSIRTYNRWQEARNKGINVGLNDIREYESGLINNITATLDKLKEQGYNPASVEIYKNKAIEEIKRGRNPSESIKDAINMITINAWRFGKFGK